MGNDISSDISSMMPDMNDSAQQDNSNNTNNNSVGHNSTPTSEQQNGTTASETKITKEKAKEIALKHANVEENKITDYEIDLDNENGVLVYEISFESNGKEYDYDVNAQTGEISNSKNELID